MIFSKIYRKTLHLALAVVLMGGIYGIWYVPVREYSGQSGWTYNAWALDQREFVCNELPTQCSRHDWDSFLTLTSGMIRVQTVYGTVAHYSDARGLSRTEKLVNYAVFQENDPRVCVVSPGEQPQENWIYLGNIKGGYEGTYLYPGTTYDKLYLMPPPN